MPRVNPESGLRCPSCGNLTSRVIDRRGSFDESRRRRECTQCRHRFTTREQLVDDAVGVERQALRKLKAIKSILDDGILEKA